MNSMNEAMNRVTPQTPLDKVLELMRQDGYVLMENALTPRQVAEISAAYDEQLAGFLQEQPPQKGALLHEIKRILEKGEIFAQLMDNAPVFNVARALLGADIELASGGELNHKLPHTPAYISWHNDFEWMTNVPYPRQNFWIRCTYFLSDVTPDGGPFTLLPGSHLKDEVCPPDENHRTPRHINGQLGITGPAGSCLINNTEIWHTNSPNNSDLPRRLIMLCYKHAWMKQWQEGYEISPEFASRQSDPVRRQLCGEYSWHNPAEHFPAYHWVATRR
jgi:ectoine hydroxylase-related dioxygenase (phytanoyl-CoA dioxygenase family)